VPPLLLPVFLLGPVQRHQQGQRPGPGGEGEADEHRQDDPLVPPAERGERVGGADGVAMAALAVDVGAGVLGDGVVASQRDGAFGRESGEDRVCEPARQRPEGPAIPGEDAVVAGGVPGCEGAEGPHQVGDGTPAQGQDGGEGEQEESVVGRAREGRFEGVEGGADHFGELLVDPFELTSRRTGLAGLLAPQGSEPFPELFPGQPRAGPVG
jgi:hypothetical protein